MAANVKVEVSRVRTREPSSSRSISTADEPQIFSPISAPSGSPTSNTHSSRSSEGEFEDEQEPELVPERRRSRGKSVHVYEQTQPQAHRRDHSRVSRRDVPAPEAPLPRQPSRNAPRDYPPDERDRVRRQHSDEYPHRRRREYPDYSDEMGPPDDRMRYHYGPRYGSPPWGYAPQGGYDPGFNQNNMMHPQSQMVPFQQFPPQPFYGNPVGSPWGQPNPLNPLGQINQLNHSLNPLNALSSAMGHVGSGFFDTNRQIQPNVASIVPYAQYYPYPVAAPTPAPAVEKVSAPAPATASAPAASEPEPKNVDIDQLKGLIIQSENRAMAREERRERAIHEEKMEALRKTAAAEAAKRAQEALDEAKKKGKAEAEEAAALLAKDALEKYEKEVAEAKAAEEKAKAAEKKAKEEAAKLKPTDDSLKPPLKFKDAIGRKFSFPWRVCKTWKGMEELIHQAFMHVDDIGKHVQAGKFDLMGPNGEIILPQVWENTVEPDWQITMHLWPILEEKKHAEGVTPALGRRRSHRGRERGNVLLVPHAKKSSRRSKSSSKVVMVPVVPAPELHHAAGPPPPPPAPAPPPAAPPEVIMVVGEPPTLVAHGPPLVAAVAETVAAGPSNPKKDRKTNQPQARPLATWIAGSLGVKMNRK